MIETAAGVEAVAAIAAEVDFLSIGTNDLTHSILDADRFSPQGAQAHDPRVLRAIATVVEAAAAARRADRGLRRGGLGPDQPRRF